MKKCNRCLKNRELSEFYNKKGTSDGKRSLCKECTDKVSKDYSTKNPDIIRSIAKKHRDNNREKASQRVKKSRSKNPKVYETYQKEYRESNKGRKNALDAKRRASKLNATPKWLSTQQLQEIKEFYDLAKELQWLSEQPLEVDHIVPLQGKAIRGLHVPWNLQILPKPLNLQKHNKL